MNQQCTYLSFFHLLVNMKGPRVYQEVHQMHSNQQKKNKDSQEPHLLFGFTQTPKKASATAQRQKKSRSMNNAPKSQESAAGTLMVTLCNSQHGSTERYDRMA